MQYPEDFLNAHHRHWRDAELLFKHRRWANADQLYGFSAECGLKAVMQMLGLGVDRNGKLEDAYRKHIQDLWRLFSTLAFGSKAANYLRILPSNFPFKDWSQNDRYANSDYFEKRSTRIHRDAAIAVSQMVYSVREGTES